MVSTIRTFRKASLPRWSIRSHADNRRPVWLHSLHFIHLFAVNLNLKPVGRYPAGDGGVCVALESSMSTVFGRRRRLVALFAWTIASVALLGITPTQADNVTVNVDEARVMKLPERVATIIIGNPLIADATLQSGHMVVTGKGFGATNLVALDRGGRVVMDKMVQVIGPSGSDLVVVFKGVERESYSCNPMCERRLTLGDSPAYFTAILSQGGTRSTQAQTPAAR